MNTENDNNLRMRIEDTASILKNAGPGIAPQMNGNPKPEARKSSEGDFNAQRLHAASNKKISSYASSSAQDTLEMHRRASRMEIDALDTKISNLDRTIELEQQKLKETKDALEESCNIRARLMFLRSAMLQFVMELESRNDV